MKKKSILVLFSVIAFPICCFPQIPEKEFWPALNAVFETSSRSRITALIERHTGEESFYEQTKVGAIFNYRAKKILNFTDHIDKDNESHLVLGGGYEFLRTDQGNGTKDEHRILSQLTPKYLFGLGILAQDRNQIEFRWIAGQFDFRYRNRLTVSRQLTIDKFRLTPYASGELFWDRNQHAWNENQYAFGVKIPYQKRLMVDTFYMRQNCTTCSLDPLDILGLTLNLYFDWPRRK